MSNGFALTTHSRIIFWLDGICPRPSHTIAGVMAYLIEIDDLRSHIRFPIPGSDAPGIEKQMSAEVLDETPPSSVQSEFDLWLKQIVPEEPPKRTRRLPEQNP